MEANNLTKTTLTGEQFHLINSQKVNSFARCNLGLELGDTAVNSFDFFTMSNDVKTKLSIFIPIIIFSPVH